MEEIYSLLQERIDNLEDIKKKFFKPDSISNTPLVEAELNNIEVTDFSQHISHIKRIEKLRIIKENELMEVIFGLRSFDVKQKL